MEEDHKRSIHQYELAIYEKEKGKEDKIRREGVEVHTSNRKRRTIIEMESVDEYDTIGGLPVEIAQMIMSFAGVKELLSIGRTSKTHRELLRIMMGRGWEINPPSTMHLRWRTYENTGFLVNSNCVISFQKELHSVGYRMFINDIMMKENPIDADKVTVISSSVIRSPSNDELWKVDGHRLKRCEMREYNSLLFTTLKEVYMDDNGALGKEDYENEYGTIRVYDTVTTGELLETLRSKGHPKYDTILKYFARFASKQDLTGVSYPYRGILVSTMFNFQITRAILVNEESMLFSVASDDGNLIQKRERRTGSLSWSVSVGAMELESACEIVNGIILFSVENPIELNGNVYAIERGPILKSLFRLRDAFDPTRKVIVKRMAYHDGIVAMILGQFDEYGSYDRIAAWDIMEGRKDDWEIDAYADEEEVTQANGLQFMIGNQYFRVVLL